MMKKITLSIFRILDFAVVFIPVILIILPVNYFDSGQTICLSQLVLKTQCPGCGITRAIQHAIHLEFKTAFEYNKLVVIVLPLLIYLYFVHLKEMTNQIKGSIKIDI
jgi:hypothetical protein